MVESLNDLQFESIMARDIRYDPGDETPDYIGLNQVTDADTTSVNWVIYKFTYSGTETIRIQKTRGAWDERTSLF